MKCYWHKVRDYVSGGYMYLLCMALFTEAQMHELNEIVAPKIMAKWESLAYCMRYKPLEVEAFRKYSQDLKERCMQMFSDWLTTSHGPTPKTYQTLLNHIKKIKDLASASEAIEKELIQGMEKLYSVLNLLYICSSATVIIINVSEFDVAINFINQSSFKKLHSYT